MFSSKMKINKGGWLFLISSILFCSIFHYNQIGLWVIPMAFTLCLVLFMFDLTVYLLLGEGMWLE